MAHRPTLSGRWGAGSAWQVSNGVRDRWVAGVLGCCFWCVDPQNRQAKSVTEQENGGSDGVVDVR